MKSILKNIYGDQKAENAFRRLSVVMNMFTVQESKPEKEFVNEKDAVLITYGDSLCKDGEQPLKTLHRFACNQLKDTFSGIHILPFYPYSSDDGFSVTDFQAIRPDLGSWELIQSIDSDYDLMVDLVANHVSAKSQWFESYLADDKGFTDLAIEVDPATDLSGVTRPRTLPLLTAFTKRSSRQVRLWTTFSADQVDLNYQSLDVLENMVRVLLFYVSQGAKMIRLDAIAYLWKQTGTPCIHLQQTHDMVRLFRRILDVKAPHVVLITETNVPHEENVGYFGNGTDEAQMVYNFTLPPLLLHALFIGSARLFSDWAQSLKTPSNQTTFFNFTASHDGIGVRPLEGIVSEKEICKLLDRIRNNGGSISEMKRPDGSSRPYEMNITYLDALKNPDDSVDRFAVDRFLASQAVALALPGVPAIYIHSLLGSQNWVEGQQVTGRARTINREKLQVQSVLESLSDPTSVRAGIFFPYLNMIRIRTRQPAFHPNSEMQILHLDDRVFAIKRFCIQQLLFALNNFSAETLTVCLPEKSSQPLSIDLLTGAEYRIDEVLLGPYETLWLTVPAGC